MCGRAYPRTGAASMVEALVTPPVGMNLYVVQGIRTTKGPMMDIVIGMIPFLAMMVLLMVALIYFPPLATWLPGYMMG